MVSNAWSQDIDFLKKARFVFVLGVLVLTCLTVSQYRGSILNYMVFTAAANGLLYFGFRRNAIFFDTFIGIFFWLGFWLKLSIRVTFFGSQFIAESTGSFDGTGAAFDSTLVVASWAFAGLISFSLIREHFLFTYPANDNELCQQGLHEFYTKFRMPLLLLFIVLIAAVAITNIYFGIYQRGSVTQTTLPYGLNGVYKWMLLFGLSSVSALIIKFEYFNNREKSYSVAFITLLETFASNVSMLSRGMVLNASALIFGFYKSLALYRIGLNIRFSIVCIFVFMVLFGSSVIAVNHIRTSDFYTQGNKDLYLERMFYQTRLLLIDRWVGIEGVMAVSSYPDKGWELWQLALREKFNENKTSFYDLNLINSSYRNVDSSRHHFISLPGIVAFSFYPGSYFFLFSCMFLAGLFAFLIELFVYKLGGRNIILCSLIAQVVAFRYSSFGYVPAQSYLLFGSIFLNIILIYWADKFLTWWYQRKSDLAS